MEYKIFHGYKIYENGMIIGLYNKPIKANLNNGRYEIRLRVDGVRKNYILSRLLAHLFLDLDIENKNKCVVHTDGNTLNIDLSNLEIKDRKDIIQGSKHVQRSKLSESDVKEIMLLYKGKVGSNQYDKNGLSLNDIAKKYNVSKSTVHSIIKKRHRNKDQYLL